jgi:hypothetical protein
MRLRTSVFAVAVCYGCLLCGCSGSQDTKPEPKDSKAAISKETPKAPDKTRYGGKGRYVDVRDPKDSPPPEEKTPEPKKPKELAKATVEGWEASGFTAGWRGTNSSHQVVFETEATNLRDAIPAFRARKSTDDAALKGLRSPELPFALILSESKVTDGGLKELGGLTNLVLLDLTFAKVTGKGVAALTDLPNLTSLALRSIDMTDADLKNVARFKKLTSLGLGNTGVTDAGLSQLAGLQNLVSLDLGGNEVTDAGLKHLASLKNLTSLNLTFTKITAAGLKEFQQAVPKCLVTK